MEMIKVDINKIFLSEFLKNAFYDSCEVKFSDGTTQKFGDDDSKFKIIINDNIPKKDIIADPFLTLGEAYMDNIIDFEGSIQEIIESVYKNKESFLHKAGMFQKLNKLKPNSIKKSKNDIQYHYDLGNDFFKLWLDDTMSYSCAYFKDEKDTLYKAQLNKIDHILKKLNLKEGQKIVDIGCGWGDLIITAAKKYNVHALGITLSSEQFKKVNETIKENNLEDKVEVRLLDYRDLAKSGEKFDRVVSVGMVEHVGKKNLSLYMETVNKLLKDGGTSLLHCITAQTEGEVNEWIRRYVFPGGYIPSTRELVALMPDYDFHLTDVESLRLHYARTLSCWASNFEEAMDEVRKMKDERFIRMWRLYLNACAASFHYGVMDINQFIFTKGLNNDIPSTRDYMYKD